MATNTNQPNESGVPDDEPCYVISIAARLVGLHQQTLRYYERAGLIEPKRTVGNIRMYSNSDIQRIRHAQRLVDELGVNLAGVEVIVRMSDQMRALQAELIATRAELDRLRATRLPAPYRGQVRGMRGRGMSDMAPPDEAVLPSKKVKGFEDLVAWQKARLLVKAINEIAEQPPIATRFGFRDQIQRAAISVMSNIVEGFDRGSRAEFHHMLSISKGSCAEVRSLLYVAVDAHYIDDATFARLTAMASEVSLIVGGLRASVGRQRDEVRAAR